MYRLFCLSFCVFTRCILNVFQALCSVLCLKKIDLVLFLLLICRFFIMRKCMFLFHRSRFLALLIHCTVFFLLIYNKLICLVKNPWHHNLVSMDIICSHTYRWFKIISVEQELLSNHTSSLYFNISMLHKPFLSVSRNLWGLFHHFVSLSLTRTTGKSLRKIMTSLYSCVLKALLVHGGVQLSCLIIECFYLISMYSETDYLTQRLPLYCMFSFYKSDLM